MKNSYLLETEDSVLLENKIEEIIKKTNFVDAYKSIYDIEDVNSESILDGFEAISDCNKMLKLEKKGGIYEN